MPTSSRADRSSALAQARDRYLRRARRRGLSPASIASYRRHIDRFVEYMADRGRCSTEQIRPRDLRAFGRYLEKHGFSEMTRGQARSILDKWIRDMAHRDEVDTKAFPATTGRRRKWSQDKIVAKLKCLHRQGISISYPGLRRAGHGNLSGAACRYFGSLSAARAAAGLG